MTVRASLWILRIFTLLFFGVFLLILWEVDPETEKMVGPLFFYLSLFLFFSGLLALFFYRLRVRNAKKYELEDALHSSFRQGTLIALLLVGLLVLQSFRMLVWWTGLIVVGVVFLIEMYFIIREKE